MMDLDWENRRRGKVAVRESELLPFLGFFPCVVMCIFVMKVDGTDKCEMIEQA
jgi:hypothetical protein